MNMLLPVTFALSFATLVFAVKAVFAVNPFVGGGDVATSR